MTEAAKTPQSLNLIQRIMKNVTTPVLIGQSRAQSRPLAEDLVGLQRVLILKQIYKACQTFDLKLEEVKSQKRSASEVEESMMAFFKFPNATYLTHTVFQQIQENLDRSAHLIAGRKTQENLAEQYSLYLLLKILTANFKALSFCSIALPDIMDEAAFQRFLAAYKQVIVRVIEGGVAQDFEDEEIRALWAEIYQMCLNILSTSINLIYSNTSEIVASLQEGLADISNEKQAANSSISINYLA